MGRNGVGDEGDVDEELSVHECTCVCLCVLVVLVCACCACGVLDLWASESPRRRLEPTPGARMFLCGWSDISGLCRIPFVLVLMAIAWCAWFAGWY